jgi:hypothetical protein
MQVLSRASTIPRCQGIVALGGPTIELVRSTRTELRIRQFLYSVRELLKVRFLLRSRNCSGVVLVFTFKQYLRCGQSSRSHDRLSNARTSPLVDRLTFYSNAADEPD